MQWYPEKQCLAIKHGKRKILTCIGRGTADLWTNGFHKVENKELEIATISNICASLTILV